MFPQVQPSLVIGLEHRGAVGQRVERGKESLTTKAKSPSRTSSPVPAACGSVGPSSPISDGALASAGRSGDGDAVDVGLRRQHDRDHRTDDEYDDGRRGHSYEQPPVGTVR